MHRTLDQIRRTGLTALRTRLGRAGMIRFLQQFETGQGDYAEQRREWLDATSLAEIRQLASQGARPKRSDKQRTRRSGR